MSLIKINKYLIKYLKWTMPLFLVLVIYVQYCDSQNIPLENNIIPGFLGEISSWIIISDFLILPVVIISMLISKELRESFFFGLAKVSEQDERETMIIGESSRKTLVSSMAILLLLFFVTNFTFSIKHLPTEQQTDGNTKRMQLGFKFDLFDTSSKTETLKDGSIVSYQGVPLSKSGLMLLLMTWQLGAFWYISRKQLAKR